MARKRRTSSFIMAQVIGRLRGIVPEEAYVAAGRAVIRDCLAVRQGERVLIIYELGFEDLGVPPRARLQRARRHGGVLEWRSDGHGPSTARERVGR